MLHAMIMAGGGGTRFWPRSRQARPKQFLAVSGDQTLLQLAFNRLEACLVPPERSWIITGKDYVAETKRQLPSLLADHVVGEPTGRDTAPCIGLGAALIARQDPDAVMLVTPADHIIEPVQEFRRAVHVAEQMATEHPDAIITFGIAPTFPSEGYGYIEQGQQFAQRQGISVYQVKKFEEKPKRPVAEQYVASGRHAWNSGIFVWKAATVLGALKQHRPALYDGVQRIAEAWATPRRQEVLEREFPLLDKISIDYAVMEKHPEVLVVQAPYRWDDVGSWLAVERLHPQDANGNTVLGQHQAVDTKNCVVVGEPGKLIATIGVEDLLVIQDGNATLVVHRSREADVKKIVEALRQQKQDEYT